jgi:hypothetical protein
MNFEERIMIPDDIISRILDYSNIKDIFVFKQSNHYIYNMIDTDYIINKFISHFTKNNNIFNVDVFKFIHDHVYGIMNKLAQSDNKHNEIETIFDSIIVSQPVLNYVTRCCNNDKKEKTIDMYKLYYLLHNKILTHDQIAWMTRTISLLVHMNQVLYRTLDDDSLKYIDKKIWSYLNNLHGMRKEVLCIAYDDHETPFKEIPISFFIEDLMQKIKDDLHIITDKKSDIHIRCNYDKFERFFDKSGILIIDTLSEIQYKYLQVEINQDNLYYAWNYIRELD